MPTGAHFLLAPSQISDYVCQQCIYSDKYYYRRDQVKDVMSKLLDYWIPEVLKDAV